MSIISKLGGFFINTEKYIEKLKIKNMNNLAKYRKKLYKRPILKDLFIEMTLRCNAKCEHCGSNCDDNIHSDEIGSEHLKRVLEDIAQNYDASEVILNITGGEPLLRKDLFEIMDHAVKLGFHWGMTTNGMLITDEILKEMERTKMETISISLDGLEETHESFRKVPNSYKKIIESIKKLQKVKTIKVVQITTVANKKNLHELEDMYKLMQDLSIQSWRILNVDPIGRAKSNSGILLDKDEYIYLFEFIRRLREENLLNVEYGCSHYLDLKYEKELRDTYFICSAGIYVASILSNGDIYVCPNVERRCELIQGNIKTDKFVDVWENKFKFFREETSKSCIKCKKCKSWNYCCGDSLHTWDFDKNEPRFCIKDLLN